MRAPNVVGAPSPPLPRKREREQAESVARIAAEHAIPIPRPRNVHDIFALEGFAAVYERIRAAIQ